MIKPASGRTFEYTPRGGVTKGIDRRLTKLLTDAVKSSLFFLIDHAAIILAILLFLFVVSYVMDEVINTQIESQNFTGSTPHMEQKITTALAICGIVISVMLVIVFYQVDNPNM